MSQHLVPKWFTPGRLLLIFCMTNLVVYLDRGLIASNGINGSPPDEANPKGTGIQGEFNLSYFQDGLLPSLFMVGLLLSSPIFAETSKHCSAFRLLGIGMAVWSLACLGCGAAPNFAILLICRAFVGVGEASFVALAAPFIDDFAPAKSKTQWFGAFFLCIPVGFAAGYIFGGLIGASMSWRWAFVIEGLAMVPFIIFALTATPLRLAGATNAGSSHSHGVGPKQWGKVLKEFAADIKLVLSQRVWRNVCCGYTLYVAVLGVYAYWGPKAGKALFFAPDDVSSTPDLVFGGVTVITGVVGSLTGGLLLDKMGSTLRNANLVCAISNLVGFVFLLLAFNASKSFAVFMALFAVGQLVIFLLQAPVAALGMWTVPPVLRPLGASLMTVCIHLFGDVPSPPFVGWVQARLSVGKSPEDAIQQWRISLSIISLCLLGSGLFFLWAAYVATPAADFRQAAAQPGGDGLSEAIDDSPLLGDGPRSSDDQSALLGPGGDTDKV